MTVYVVVRTWGIVKREQIVCIKDDMHEAEKTVTKLRIADYSDDRYHIEIHNVEFKKEKNNEK